MKQQYTIGDVILIFIAAMVSVALNPAWKMLPLTLIIQAVLIMYLKKGKLYRKCFYFKASHMKYLLLPVIEVIFFDVIVNCYAYFEKGYTIDINMLRDVALELVAVGVREETGLTFLWFVVAMMIMVSMKTFNEFDKRNLIKLSVLVTIIFTVFHIGMYILYWEALTEQFKWGKLEASLGVIVCALGVFCTGLYMKVTYLKTHNILLAIMIHILINIVEQCSLWNSMMGMEIAMIGSLVREIIYLLVIVHIIRSEWDCNFWNEEFQLLK